MCSLLHVALHQTERTNTAFEEEERPIHEINPPLTQWEVPVEGLGVTAGLAFHLLSETTKRSLLGAQRGRRWLFCFQVLEPDYRDDLFPRIH